jgi:coenzyme F420-0:L-glutamate ligase/coenzyme F420-1:gamma-L-glutamate ligase
VALPRLRLTAEPLPGLPEVRAGDDLAAMIADAAEAAVAGLRGGEALVVAQKVVSKAEGRIVEVDPADRERARREWAEREARRIVARRDDLLIAETAGGFVCANSGVDASNLPPDRLALLPLDPDGSASRLRQSLKARDADVGVVISDTFGRAWRAGQTNVAIGVAGISAVRDHRGDKDTFGSLLEATVIAVADEIAGAAELVMGKTNGVPAAIVRGLDVAGEGSARELVMPPERDLFR